VQEADAYKESTKLSAMSAANPDAPTDFIVDSSFPGINSIISDVIPEMINAVAFGDSSVDEVLKNAQAKADEIVANYN
jgi:multiple sugar transport system substrate-binding protein